MIRGLYLAAAALVLIIGTRVTAEVIDVQHLNRTLVRQNAGWTAKQNVMSDLRPEEAVHRLGLREEMPSAESVDFRVARDPHATFDLPVRFDWRNRDGVNWVSPILDQGNCGSCVAFAAIGVLETQWKITNGMAGLNLKLSPQNAFACGGGSCNFGWWPEFAARYLQRSGVPDEACMPYTSGATGEDVACRVTCADADRRSVKLSSYSTPTRRVANVEAVKRALQNGPLVTTLSVYADFMAYGSGVYKHVSGEMLGGHAISIVGYDDAKQAYIVRNSWGDTWGENGFGYVAYDDHSGVGDQTWSYVLPDAAGAVGLQSPLDYSYFSKTASLSAQSTFARTDGVTIAVYGPEATTGAAVANVHCTNAMCAQNMDITTLPDGRYEVQAIAHDGVGQELGRSARQFFYVANQKPTLQLDYEGVNGTDLSQALSDRIEVAVHATSSSVPFSSVAFHYRGADGVDHFRAAQVVVEGLTMGWRTNLLPDGEYEIWMTGEVKTNTDVTAIETAHRKVTLKN